MHFDGFAFSGDVSWGEGDEHSWFEDTGFDSSARDSSDSGDLVDVLKGKSEWLVKGSDWGFDFVKSLKEGVSLVPGHVG